MSKKVSKRTGRIESQPGYLTVRRDIFYVGGKYCGPVGHEYMDGQMYVERLTPKKQRHPYPLVLIHGAAHTASIWLTTPDGREGWADYFLRQGYVVILVDQPRRGRSVWHPSTGLTLRTFDVPTIARLFFSSQPAANWPQAMLHSQWPGEARMGDPVFDQFVASQVEFISSNEETQRAMQTAGAALLDRIGPAILVTHSQAGPCGWAIADVRPSLVKGIVAIEPQGPPLQNAVLGDAYMRPWGITDIPLEYEGLEDTTTPIKGELEALPDGPNLVKCWCQSAPARKLRNLAGIPILIVVGEASYHTPYDHCTSKWLTQSGVENEFVRLESVGIRGNGHMQMIEKNNLEIAEWLDGWIKRIRS